MPAWLGKSHKNKIMVDGKQVAEVIVLGRKKTNWLEIHQCGNWDNSYNRYNTYSFDGPNFLSAYVSDAGTPKVENCGRYVISFC